MLAVGAITGGVLLSVAWVAFKVGALSYGGGFVIIPLMQADAVNHYHWMTAAQFLNAVALGQITPGPVVQTVAVVGYAAAGLGRGHAGLGGRLRAVVQLRAARRAAASTACAATTGPAPSSAAPGPPPSAPSSARPSPWPARSPSPGSTPVLAAALVLMLALRRGVVLTLIAAAAAGTLIALAGGPLPH